MQLEEDLLKYNKMTAARIERRLNVETVIDIGEFKKNCYAADDSDDFEIKEPESGARKKS